ncbi:putative protein FAM91A1-like isoform X1 [Capsicum annuum]|nr:putative protein FAM91A1-like isoform X1 [Capsicum annuum]
MDLNTMLLKGVDFVPPPSIESGGVEESSIHIPFHKLVYSEFKHSEVLLILENRATFSATSSKLVVALVRLEPSRKKWDTRLGKSAWLHHMDSTLKGLGNGLGGSNKGQEKGYELLTVVEGRGVKWHFVSRFNRARAAQLILPHYECQTPLFMPVGTQGTIKGLTTHQLEDIGCQIILGNTYHLALCPTSELIDEVSLLHLADITEKGVTFQSPVDGKPMLLTPEESIQIQNRIGADIIMALDDVVKTTITGPRIEEAMYRTLRWIDRCIAGNIIEQAGGSYFEDEAQEREEFENNSAVSFWFIWYTMNGRKLPNFYAHKKPHEQNLFGIVQGGLDPVLRDICVKGLVERNLPGYAIGGLAGGEDKDSFWRVVAQCTAALPEHKPRYVMGVGYPLDIVVCSALGADMYDCVYPTRTARFGTALVPEVELARLAHYLWDWMDDPFLSLPLVRSEEQVLPSFS